MPNREEITVYRTNKRQVSKCQLRGKRLKAMAHMDASCLTPFFRKALMKNRSSFTATFGTDDNVLNPVVAVCPLCGKDVSLSEWASFGPLYTHFKRSHNNTTVVEAMKNKMPIELELPNFVLLEESSRYLHLPLM